MAESFWRRGAERFSGGAIIAGSDDAVRCARFPASVGVGTSADRDAPAGGAGETLFAAAAAVERRAAAAMRCAAVRALSASGVGVEEGGRGVGRDEASVRVAVGAGELLSGASTRSSPASAASAIRVSVSIELSMDCCRVERGTPRRAVMRRVSARGQTFDT